MRAKKAAACALALCLSGAALAGCAAQGASSMPAPEEQAAPASVPEEQEAPASAAEGQAERVSEEQTESSGERAGQDAAEPVHEHVWVADYVLETTDAETETVHHDAETETVTEYHTLCNVCFAIIDDKVEEHQAATGHLGASTNVPVEVEKVKAEAYDEERVVSPEESRLVSRTETCVTCGEQREREPQTADPDEAANAVAAAASSGVTEGAAPAAQTR